VKLLLLRLLLLLLQAASVHQITPIASVTVSTLELGEIFILID